MESLEKLFMKIATLKSKTKLGKEDFEDILNQYRIVKYELNDKEFSNNTKDLEDLLIKVSKSFPTFNKDLIVDINKKYSEISVSNSKANYTKKMISILEHHEESYFFPKMYFLDTGLNIETENKLKKDGFDVSRIQYV